MIVNSVHVSIDDADDDDDTTFERSNLVYDINCERARRKIYC